MATDTHTHTHAERGHCHDNTNSTLYSNLLAEDKWDSIREKKIQ